MSAGRAAAPGAPPPPGRFAEVSVDGPREPEPPPAAAGRPAARDTFHYAVPPHMAAAVAVGRRVWVPFGRRRCEGVVVALHATSPVERTRDILDVLDDGPLLGPAEIALARWIAGYYLAPFHACLRLWLPPGRVLHAAHRIRQVVFGGGPLPEPVLRANMGRYRIGGIVP